MANSLIIETYVIIIYLYYLFIEILETGLTAKSKYFYGLFFKLYGQVFWLEHEWSLYGAARNSWPRGEVVLLAITSIIEDDHDTFRQRIT